MKLYKYRCFDNHAEAIFTRYEMYFPRPVEFNDPFDCRMPVSFSGATENDYRKLLEKFLPICYEQNGLVITHQQLKSGINQEFTSKDFDKLAKDIQDGFSNGILNNHGIFCMSEKNDDILMWSHYAHSHCGFCLEFPDSGIFQMAKRVIYTDAYPQANFFEKSIDELTNDVLLTKSDSWAYEEEWRILQRDITPGVHCFGEPGFLTGVIFGLLMPKKEKQKIRNWIEQGKHEVQFYQVQMREGVFGLKIIPIS